MCDYLINTTNSIFFYTCAKIFNFFIAFNWNYCYLATVRYFHINVNDIKCNTIYFCWFLKRDLLLIKVDFYYCNNLLFSIHSVYVQDFYCERNRNFPFKSSFWSLKMKPMCNLVKTAVTVIATCRSTPTDSHVKTCMHYFLKLHVYSVAQQNVLGSLNTFPFHNNSGWGEFSQEGAWLL